MAAVADRNQATFFPPTNSDFNRDPDVHTTVLKLSGMASSRAVIRSHKVSSSKSEPLSIASMVWRIISKVNEDNWNSNIYLREFHAYRIYGTIWVNGGTRYSHTRPPVPQTLARAKIDLVIMLLLRNQIRLCLITN